MKEFKYTIDGKEYHVAIGGVSDDYVADVTVNGETFQVQMEKPEEPEKMGWTVLRVCAMLPLGEELIFRGGVQRLLRPLGPGVALAGQAVLFAAAHGSAEAKIYAFAMGLVFGWAVEHTGRIWPGMGLHCLNNCIVLAGCLAERGLG